MDMLISIKVSLFNISNGEDGIDFQADPANYALPKDQSKCMLWDPTGVNEANEVNSSLSIDSCAIDHITDTRRFWLLVMQHKKKLESQQQPKVSLSLKQI